MSTQSRGAISRRYFLYQLRISSDFELSGRVVDDHEYDLEFVRANSADAQPFELTDLTRQYNSPTSGAVLYVDGSWICLRYPEIADFFVSEGKRVVCYLDPNASEAIVKSLLQGPVCAVLLEMRGSPCLHASAVQVNDHAVAFLGMAGSGKSSLATRFVWQDYPLVTDDILPLTIENFTCLATPGYPQIKLCTDMASCFALDSEMDASLKKHLQPVGQAWGSFAKQRLPLGVAYLLERETYLQPTVMIEELGPRERFVEMLRYSFCAGAIASLGLEATRFHRLGEMAELISVRRLRYANGVENLESVCTAVLSDCEK